MANTSVDRVKAIAGLQDVQTVLFEHLTTGVDYLSAYVWIIENSQGDKVSVLVANDVMEMSLYHRQKFEMSIRKHINTFMTEPIIGELP